MKIAVIGGDGTGPEVTDEALKVLDAVSKAENFEYELTHLDWGSERYMKTGKLFLTAVSNSLNNTMHCTSVQSVTLTLLPV